MKKLALSVSILLAVFLATTAQVSITRSLTNVFANLACFDAANKDVCLQRQASGIANLTAGSAGTTFTRINFGTALSSNPALKVNGTQLQMRLGDDSAFGPFVASELRANSRIQTAGAATGVSATTAGNIPTEILVMTVDRTAFVCAAVTCDVTVATIAAKGFVQSAVADLTQTFACTATCTTSTLSFVFGKTAGGNEYLLSFDADAATGQFGRTAATEGAALAPATMATPLGDNPSWSGTTNLVLRLTSGTGNIGNASVTNLSQGSVTIYLTTSQY